MSPNHPDKTKQSVFGRCKSLWFKTVRSRYSKHLNLSLWFKSLLAKRFSCIRSWKIASYILHYLTSATSVRASSICVRLDSSTNIMPTQKPTTLHQQEWLVVAANLWLLHPTGILFTVNTNNMVLGVKMSCVCESTRYRLLPHSHKSDGWMQRN